MFEICCKKCGNTITKEVNGYCSECYQKSNIMFNSNLFPSSIIKKCLKCGIKFENKSSKFCSLECATAYSLIMNDIK